MATRCVYLNGEWPAPEDAAVSAQDRGFLFADGVYEVVRYYNGYPVAMEDHLARLDFSLRSLRIQPPPERPRLRQISDTLVRANATPDASVYWQVTRGPGPRDRRFPEPPPRPTVYAAVTPADPLALDGPVETLRAVTHQENRWPHSAIKSVALLPTLLARQAAAEAGADEAIYVRDRVVTEGTSTSIVLVRGSTLHVHPLDGSILGSITRQLVLGLAPRHGLSVEPRRCAVGELFRADEVLSLGTTTEVASVVRIDGQPVGGGAVGPVARRLSRAYRTFAADACGLGPVEP